MYAAAVPLDIASIHALSLRVPVEATPELDDGTGPYYWLDDVPTLLRLAGSPEGWIDPLLAIVDCETGRYDKPTGRRYVRAGAIGDHGASLGAAQLNWKTWFPAAVRLGMVAETDYDRWGDILVNLRVAVAVRATRGHYGGGGGWSCATLLGIE